MRNESKQDIYEEFAHMYFTEKEELILTHVETLDIDRLQAGILIGELIQIDYNDADDINNLTTDSRLLLQDILDYIEMGDL